MTRRRDIQQLLKTGRRYSTPALMLRASPNLRSFQRVTVVVGLAVSKRATMRNTLKRQLRHILKDELKGSRIGADIMLSTKAAALRLGRDERVSAVRFLLGRANLLKR